MRTVEALGAASCIAGNRFGCCGGPQVLRRSGLIGALARRHGLRLNWRQVLEPQFEVEKEAALALLCEHIGRRVRSLVADAQPFIFMGGDHSCAMGVWGGALSAIRPRRDLGLIWIDAHMDSHNFSTTPSGNIHGMPLAALLGQADPRLAAIYGDRPFLKPSNVVLIGVRSFEPAEQQLLKRSGGACLQYGGYSTSRWIGAVVAEGVDAHAQPLPELWYYHRSRCGGSP